MEANGEIQTQRAGLGHCLFQVPANGNVGTSNILLHLHPPGLDKGEWQFMQCSVSLHLDVSPTCVCVTHSD